MSNEIEIGRGKRGRRAFSFDDVAVVPSRRTRDPKEVSVGWQIDAYHFELPILAAPMDSVMSPATAVALGNHGGLGVLDLEGLWTRYDDPTALLEEIATLEPLEATRRMQEIYAEPIKADLITQRLKEIRAAVPQATINDVGVAVVGGAIRRYLLDKDELPEAAMVAMMPISIRPLSTRASGTATSATSTETAGNEYSIAPITMATDEADPLKRLARIVTSTAHVKDSGAHPVRSLIAMSEEAFGGLMGTVQRAAVRALSRTGRTVAAHTLVSNVPGPRTSMYFCGAEMVDTTGLGPVLDGMGLNNGIGSYGNRVTFCFTADRKALPDPEVYEQCLSGAVDELLEAARAVHG